jgi:superfamily II DNA/RNA helicase
MPFKDLISNAKILQTLEQLGFTSPTPIQIQAIPELIQRKDLRAVSQTGSGKTAAFLLPLLMRLSEEKGNKLPRVLILAPTRELAMQIAAEAVKLGKNLGLVIVTLFGGVPYHKQYRDLSKPHDILIATPGRLLDHLERKRARLGHIQTLVLDEADRMLDMGFIGPVEEIAAATPALRQTVMFSATFGKGVKKLSETLLRNPFEIVVSAAEKRQEHIEQTFYSTKSLEDKLKHLDQILSHESVDQAIIFSATKMQTEKLAEELRKRGLQVAALHGDMRQNQRTRTTHQFRTGKVRLLVATDVAARGIDVLSISHVINFDAPNTLDDYIHRIGRTGRAGGKGFAFSFFSYKDRYIQKEIEKFYGVAIAPSAAPKKRIANGSPAAYRKSNQRRGRRF